MKSLFRFLAIVLLLIVAAPIALLALVILVPITAPLMAAAAVLAGAALLALLPLALLALPFLLVYALCRMLAASEPSPVVIRSEPAALA